MPTTIFTDPLQFALTCVILVAAQIIYVLFGFGSGLTAVGLLNSPTRSSRDRTSKASEPVRWPKVSLQSSAVWELLG